MIFDFFKISGDNEAILDFRDSTQVQLRSDKFQASCTTWDEVLSSVTDRPTDNILETLCTRCKMQKSEEEVVIALQTTSGDKKYDSCRWKLMVQRHLEHKIKHAHFKARHRTSRRGQTCNRSSERKGSKMKTDRGLHPLDHKRPMFMCRFMRTVA